MAAAGESGRLRIGIHALIPRSFLAKLIGRYRKAYPGVEVEITEGPAREGEPAEFGKNRTLSHSRRFVIM
ncbi:LysR substrate-binding domain-containing protein, partial [Pseudomonas aeruginosa]